MNQSQQIMLELRRRPPSMSRRKTAGGSVEQDLIDKIKRNGGVTDVDGKQQAAADKLKAKGIVDGAWELVTTPSSNLGSTKFGRSGHQRAFTSMTGTVFFTKKGEKEHGPLVPSGGWISDGKGGNKRAKEA